jgi:RHS repeat-associated protein
MFYYTRDHLGSIRELTDSGGNVRARYAYDPFGRRTRLTGDVEADFGFAGMFWSAEASLSLTHFRAYDPELGRWLSRDPLRNAEVSAGPNLYAYVVNDPVNRIDPEGLCAGTPCLCGREPGLCATIIGVGAVGGGAVVYEIEEATPVLESVVVAAEDAAGALENALVCRGGELQGMLNYVNPFANTFPAIVNIAASVPRVAEVALSLKDRTILSLDWLFEAMYETRFYRDYLDATDQSEAKREFIAKLGEWSKALFGL